MDELVSDFFNNWVELCVLQSLSSRFNRRIWDVRRRGPFLRQLALVVANLLFRVGQWSEL